MKPVAFKTVLFRRRDVVRHGLLASALLAVPCAGRAQGRPRSFEPDVRWYQAAALMRKRAESWGDQPYGAVLVLNGELVGEGPSRVVLNANPDAHAEREAIRDAQRRLPGQSLAGSVLYSTSRPCPICEAAAAVAGVRRMYFGEQLMDGGVPR